MKEKIMMGSVKLLEQGNNLSIQSKELWKELQTGKLLGMSLI